MMDERIRVMDVLRGKSVRWRAGYDRADAERLGETDISVCIAKAYEITDVVEVRSERDGLMAAYVYYAPIMGRMLVCVEVRGNSPFAHHAHLFWIDAPDLREPHREEKSVSLAWLGFMNYHGVELKSLMDIAIGLAREDDMLRRYLPEQAPDTV